MAEKNQEPWRTGFTAREVYAPKALSQSNYTNVIKFLAGAELISEAAKEVKGGKKRKRCVAYGKQSGNGSAARRLFKLL